MISDGEGQDGREDTAARTPRTAIGVRTATILYLLLAIAAGVTLKGKPLLLALIIVFGLAAKSYLHYWRQKENR